MSDSEGPKPALVEVNLTLPASKEAIAELAVGSIVFLKGVVLSLIHI